MQTSLTGLYIHIPFCQSKCDYCDFLSFDNKQSVWSDYKDALISEIKSYKPTGPIDTVYIGGGTPTVWPSSFLLELLQALPAALPDAEITCEANPGTLTQSKIAALAEGGCNRISLGLQAWQSPLLKAIGRKTGGASNKIFLENYQALRKAGFKNINIDIMFALPGQQLDDWEETLRQVAGLNPEHISAYGLTPEEGTLLWSRLNSGANNTEAGIDEETDRLMYHNCKSFLQKQGYFQYELSNFCKPGFESRHNLRYWTRKPYIGFGLGAHSFENEVRWNNTGDLSLYLQQRKVRENFISISKTDAMAEFMFLGLRKTNGISALDFAAEFNCILSEVYGDWINKMENDGLLLNMDDRIYLTDRGMDLANYVMAGFLSD